MGMVVEAAGALRRHCEPVVELRGLSEFGCVGRPCDDVMVRRSVWPRSHSCEAARGVICVSRMSLVVYDAEARKYCVRDSTIFIVASLSEIEAAHAPRPADGVPGQPFSRKIIGRSASSSYV